MKRWYVWFLVISALVIGGCGKEDKLAKDLKSKDPDVRIAAARELGELGTAQALTELSLVEEDKDRNVREAISAAIKKINSQTFLK